jgi:hypothetical protein
MKSEKSKKSSRKSKHKAVRVKVANQPIHVETADKAYLLTLFEGREVPPDGRAMGPLGGLDLTGCSEYRLTLHFAGTPGTPFEILELFGPAGTVDQVAFEVGRGQIGPQGVLNYRGRFEIFGPRNFFIQVVNKGQQALQVNGTLYAVQ